MRERGGDWPACDHGIFTEVSPENDMYFRRRCPEFA